MWPLRKYIPLVYAAGYLPLPPAAPLVVAVAPAVRAHGPSPAPLAYLRWTYGSCFAPHDFYDWAPVAAWWRAHCDDAAYDELFHRLVGLVMPWEFSAETLQIEFVRLCVQAVDLLTNHPCCDELLSQLCAGDDAAFPAASLSIAYELREITVCLLRVLYT